MHVSRAPTSGSVPLKDLPRTRVAMLEDEKVGFAVLSELDDQVLIAPRSLSVAVLNDLKCRIEARVSSFIRRPYTLQLVRYNDENKRTLREQVKAVVDSLNLFDIRGGRGVLVLPSHSQPDLHNYIKKSLRERVQFQCMSAAKLCSFYPSSGNENKYTNGTGHPHRNGPNQAIRAARCSLLIALFRRAQSYSATLRLFKVESGINGLLPTSWVPSIYSVSRLSRLRSALGRLLHFAFDSP